MSITRAKTEAKLWTRILASRIFASRSVTALANSKNVIPSANVAANASINARPALLGMLRTATVSRSKFVIRLVHSSISLTKRLVSVSRSKITSMRCTVAT